MSVIASAFVTAGTLSPSIVFADDEIVDDLSMPPEDEIKAQRVSLSNFQVVFS
jgi:hypothetical protein